VGKVVKYFQKVIFATFPIQLKRTFFVPQLYCQTTYISTLFLKRLY